jgi:hypothetical protein
MEVAQGLTSSGLLAYRGGTLVVIGVVLGAILAIYAVYWLFFRAGKE